MTSLFWFGYADASCFSFLTVITVTAFVGDAPTTMIATQNTAVAAVHQLAMENEPMIVALELAVVAKPKRAVEVPETGAPTRTKLVKWKDA